MMKCEGVIINHRKKYTLKVSRISNNITSGLCGRYKQTMDTFSADFARALASCSLKTPIETPRLLKMD